MAPIYNIIQSVPFRSEFLALFTRHYSHYSNSILSARAIKLGQGDNIMTLSVLMQTTVKSFELANVQHWPVNLLANILYTYIHICPNLSKINFLPESAPCTDCVAITLDCNPLPEYGIFSVIFSGGLVELSSRDHYVRGLIFVSTCPSAFKQDAEPRLGYSAA